MYAHQPPVPIVNYGGSGIRQAFLGGGNFLSGPRNFFSGPGLGQPAAWTLSDDDRQTVIGLIDKDVMTYNEVHGFAQRGDIRGVMGPYYAEFAATMSVADQKRPAMDAVWNRLQQGSGENSYWTEDERAAYVMFHDAVTKAQSLAVQGQSQTAAGRQGAGAPLPAAPTKAAAKPVAPTAKAPGVPSAPPKEAEILGIPQSAAIAGAGVLVGVGVLAAVL